MFTLCIIAYFFSLGFLGPSSHSELEPALLSLTPTEELNDHRLALTPRDTLYSNVNNADSPPDHSQLLAEESPRDSSLGLNVEDNSSTFNLTLLTQDLVYKEGSLCPYPENRHSSDTGLQSDVLTISSFSPFLELNVMSQHLLPSASGNLFFDEDSVEDEDDLPSPLNDLIEDPSILDEIKVLDLALEEGFNPEMAARLYEEGYLYREETQQETERDNDHSDLRKMVTEDQRQHQGYQQGNLTKSRAFYMFLNCC